MFSVFASDICAVIYSSTEAAEYLKALAPLMPVMFLDTVTDSILKGLGKQVYTMCVNIADAAISVLFVWLLVPRIGVYGYIFVIFISECVNTVFSIGKLMATVDFKIRIKKVVLSPLVSAVFAANLAHFIMSNAPLSLSVGTLIFECIMYTVFYIAAARFFGAVGKEEFLWIKRIVKDN